MQGDKSIPADLYQIALPPITDCLQGLLTVIPLQLLSYHLAVVRGYNVRPAACTDWGGGRVPLDGC